MLQGQGSSAAIRCGEHAELQPATLDEQVAEIHQWTVDALHGVPFDCRYGDWDALISKHHAMLDVLLEARKRLGALQVPADLAGAWRFYLDATDHQLELEHAVLGAARSRNMGNYRAACRAIAAAVRSRGKAEKLLGLRAAGPTRAQQTWVWITLPWHLVRATRHASAERAAGRSWN